MAKIESGDILNIAIIAGLGFAGYKIYKAFSGDNYSSTGSGSSGGTGSPIPAYSQNSLRQGDFLDTIRDNGDQLANVTGGFNPFGWITDVVDNIRDKFSGGSSPQPYANTSLRGDVIYYGDTPVASSAASTIAAFKAPSNASINGNARTFATTQESVPTITGGATMIDTSLRNTATSTSSSPAASSSGGASLMSPAYSSSGKANFTIPTTTNQSVYTPVPTQTKNIYYTPAPKSLLRR